MDKKEENQKIINLYFLLMKFGILIQKHSSFSFYLCFEHLEESCGIIIMKIIKNEYFYIGSLEIES